MTQPAKFVVSTLILFLTAAVIASGTLLYFAYQGQTDGEKVDVIIKRGSSLAQVAETLEKEGVIARPKLFKWMLRVTGGNKQVRAGEFHFAKNMKLFDALNNLYTGEPIVHPVTIPEGWTARQIAQILAAKNLVDEQKFIDIALNPATAARYKLNTPSLEGFLFPETYHFSKIDGEERIIEKMVNSFHEHFNKEYLEEMKLKGWTLERLVTLASIVEKETGVEEERTLVSSVFHNRLKKHMKLQSDPTTIYGIPNFNGNITKADLLRYSPYNTYVIPELPPGPISNPGLASLIAAMRPAESEYLFFVSNNNGNHIFSKTYGQHAGKVNEFQKRGLSNGGRKKKSRR